VGSNGSSIRDGVHKRYENKGATRRNIDLLGYDRVDPDGIVEPTGTEVLA
jgi:hypothetical protein